MNINTLNESTFLSNLRFYFLCIDNAKLTYHMMKIEEYLVIFLL